MRQVSIPGFAIPPSALGFGCASLGSRISAADGRVAIEAALEAGVTWFDVAPSYGDGRAEVLLGAALGANAGRVAIATKFGLAAKPPGFAKRMIGAVARPVVAAVPALRGIAKRSRPGVAVRTALDARSLRESLSRSLERLRTDCVALLALHEPTIADVRKEEVARALDDVKREGLATLVGIAGDTETFLAARAAGCPADVLQCAHSPFAPNLVCVPADARPILVVTHSVYGVSGALDDLVAATREACVATAILKLGYAPDRVSLARLLMDYAFASNPDGVVLASSYGRGHLAANVVAASRAPRHDVVDALDAILADRRWGPDGQLGELRHEAMRQPQ